MTRKNYHNLLYGTAMVGLEQYIDFLSFFLIYTTFYLYPDLPRSNSNSEFIVCLIGCLHYSSLRPDTHISQKPCLLTNSPFPYVTMTNNIQTFTIFLYYLVEFWCFSTGKLNKLSWTPHIQRPPIRKLISVILYLKGVYLEKSTNA